MTELSPSPPVVAGLLIRMTRLDWPTSEADRRRYFDLLGLHDLDTVPQRHDEPDGTMIRFATSLLTVQGTCTLFREEFLGLHLFCYDEAREDGPEARAGYAGLRNQLGSYLGPPI